MNDSRDREWRDDPRPHRHDVECCDDECCDDEYETEEVDDVEALKDMMFDIVQDAFEELVHEKAKALLKTRLGDKIDEMAETVVEHFIKLREFELGLEQAEEEFDEKFRATLKK